MYPSEVSEVSDDNLTLWRGQVQLWFSSPGLLASSHGGLHAAQLVDGFDEKRLKIFVVFQIMAYGLGITWT